jgi:predicted PurR-regulated permease PerM
MNMKLSPGWLCGGLIVVLSAWILHSFLEAILAACVTAIASWPLYTRFAARLPRRIGRSSKSLIFTLAMTVFVLVPLMFAFGALLTEAHVLILEIAAADKKGIAAPQWLENAPLVGAMARRALGESAGLPRRPCDMDAADRRGGPSYVGAVAWTIHDAARVYHLIYDLAVVLPLSGR